MKLKQILIAVVVLLVVIGIVVFTVKRANAGTTKVLTGKVTRGEIVSTVSGTGEIKPKTFVNIGATAFGRITHLYVKEGQRVHRGDIVATVESVQPASSVDAQKQAIAAAKTDISAAVAAEATAQANIDHAQADLEQKELDYHRYQQLYQERLVSKADFDARKAAYDTDVATLAQSKASLLQAKAQTDSSRGHLGTANATLRSDVDALNKTVSIAPFDGLVTNLPVREGETVVVGIQNAEGSTLMTIADMSVITAEVKIDETDIVNVKVGQTADITVDALQDKVFHGHVTLVGDQALLRSTGVSTSQSTGGTQEAKDFKVVVTLDEGQDFSSLRPGLSTTAKIMTADKKDVLSVPIQALAQQPSATALPKGKVKTYPANTQGLFVLQHVGKNLRAHFVPVTAGITGTTNAEVTGPIKAGDEIVTGTYKILRGLKDDTAVKSASEAELAKEEGGS